MPFEGDQVLPEGSEILGSLQMSTANRRKNATEAGKSYLNNFSTR